jgi:hypothetical protein
MIGVESGDWTTAVNLSAKVGKCMSQMLDRRALWGTPHTALSLSSHSAAFHIQAISFITI